MAERKLYTIFNGDFDKIWLTKDNYFDHVSTVGQPSHGYKEMIIENDKPDVPDGKKLVRVLWDDGDVIRKRYELFGTDDPLPDPVMRASYEDLRLALRRFGVEV